MEGSADRRDSRLGSSGRNMNVSTTDYPVSRSDPTSVASKLQAATLEGSIDIHRTLSNNCGAHGFKRKNTPYVIRSKDGGTRRLNLDKENFRFTLLSDDIQNGRDTSGKTKSQGVQTVKRESETQTAPFSADIIIRTEKDLDILNAATLQLDNDTVFTTAEYDIIQNMKRLPIEEKLKLIEGREFAVHLADSLAKALPHPGSVEDVDEKKISTVRRTRAEEIDAAVDLFREKLTNMRGDSVKKRMLQSVEESDRREFEIHRSRMRGIRLLMHEVEKEQKRHNPTARKSKIEVVNQTLANTVSYAVYKSKPRSGARLRRQSGVGVRMNMQSVGSLLKYMEPPQHREELDIPTMVKRMARKQNVEKMSFRERQKLKQSMQALNDFYSNTSNPDNEDLTVAGGFDVPRDASTPQQNAVVGAIKLPVSNESLNHPVVMIQQILRGNQAKVAMLNECNRFAATIKELRMAHKMKGEKDPHEVQQMIEDRAVKQADESKFEAAVGEILSEALEELSNSHQYHSMLENFRAMVDEAKWTRDMKEMKELGRRQADELLREREAILFNGTNRCIQKTVDSFLDEILQTSISLHAKQKVLEEESIRSAYLEPHLDALEESLSTRKGIVHSLVHHFLVPNVQAKLLAQRWKVLDTRHHYAATKALEAAMKKVAEP